MVAGLVALATEAAAAGVLAGMLLAWGLAGGDGVEAHPVPALLGLVLFGGTIATLVVVVGLFDGWTGAAVAATVFSAMAGAMAWLSWQPSERDRRPLYWALTVAAVLVILTAVACGSGDQAVTRSEGTSGRPLEPAKMPNVVPTVGS